MKSLINILAAASIFTIGVATTGCNDLEQPPTNKYTDSNFWTAKNAETMVMTAYSQMYSAGRMWGDEELTDNLYSGYRSEERHNIRRGIATSSLGIFSWNEIYQGIKSCNTFLAHADDIKDLDAETINRLKAETRFIRDLLYFRLANLYGDVPLFMEDISLNAASNIARTPHNQVIETIVADLENLINDLPLNTMLPESERGRITQGAVAMLLARIALMESDWSTVVKWCQAIVNGEYGQYALFNSYEGLFKEENEYNCEVILDCGYVTGVRTWGEISAMKPSTLRSSYVTWTPTESLVESYMTLSGYTITESGTDYNPANPYANRDPRLAATVVFDNSELYDPSTGKTHTIYINPDTQVSDDNVGIGSGLTRTVTGYYTRKWFAPITDDTGYNSGLNIIMMRYADVLLMLAEAKYELGEMNESIWNQTIRPIRERAGFVAEKALVYPSGDLRQTIRNERRVELALEGLRWWDIKRWKAGKEYLDGPVKGCTYVGGAAVLDNYSFDENRDYLWAVPLDEIDFNPNLKPQNPGYGN